MDMSREGLSQGRVKGSTRVSSFGPGSGRHAGVPIISNVFGVHSVISVHIRLTSTSRLRQDIVAICRLANTDAAQRAALRKCSST